MKKGLRSATAALLLLFTTSTFAATNASDKSVEEARKVNVKNILTQLNYLTNLTVRYVNLTLDTTPTRGEIENYFNKKDLDLWKNYRNENCAETDGVCNDNTTGGIALAFDVASNKLEFENVMGDISTLSTTEAETYKTYKNYDGIGQLSPDETKINFDFFNFPSLESTLLTIENCNDNVELECSVTEPMDQTKQWIKPKGDGTFETLSYDLDNAVWKKYKEDKDGNLIFYSSDNFNPTTTPGVKGQYALNQTEDGWLEYIYDGSEWIAKVTGSIGAATPFNGTGSIIAMATTKFNSTGGSIMTSPAPDGEWGGSLEFAKLEDATYGGYWKSAANDYMVADTVESLNYFSDNFLVGTVAWIAKGSNDVIKLEKRTLPDASVEWVYIASDYADLQNFKETAQIGNVGTYIYVSSHSEYFYFDTDVFKPHLSGAGVTYVTFSANARNQFIPASGKTYLSQTNDCDATSCNGDAGTSYYAGSTIDGLYAYYYSVSGNNKNTLADITAYTSWTTLWNDAMDKAQWNGTTFGDISTGTILIKDTINGRISYKTDIGHINKNQGYYIPQNKLPSGIFADSATMSKVSTTVYVHTSSLDQFISDTNLDIGYTVRLTGSGFTSKYFTRCSDYANDNLWSDNCTSLTSSTVAVTNGSRSDISSPTSSVRLNLTKQIGIESKYTAGGIIYSGDAGYYKWNYITSGTRTNNLSDAEASDSYGNIYLTIQSPTTGKVWLDRNLGASQKCTSYNDSNCYGHYYQWGRIADGHQISNSSVTTTLSASSSSPGGSNFIKAPNSPYDWSTADSSGTIRQTNWNPCPSGFRIPTESEWTAEEATFENYNEAFTQLALPAAGYRNTSDAAMYNLGTNGFYWSSTPASPYSRNMYFSSSQAYMYSYRRAHGFSVRCLKN